MDGRGEKSPVQNKLGRKQVSARREFQLNMPFPRAKPVVDSAFKDNNQQVVAIPGGHRRLCSAKSYHIL